MHFPHFALFISVSLLASLPGFAQEAKKSQNGFCIQELNKEMKNLGMGSFTSPASGVSHEGNDKNISFSRDAGDMPQVVSIHKLFSDNVQMLKVRMPTVLFGHYEEKEITFNDKCEVTAVALVADGTAAHLDVKRCEAILKAKKASVAKNGGNNLIENSLRGEYPGHGWAKCENVFSTAVVELCQNYEKQFPKKQSGGDANDDEASEPGQTTAR
jgi:hypothetical protein